MAIRRVNTRVSASTASKKLIPLEIGQSIRIKRIELGELYRGSRLWLVDENENKYWSGAFEYKDRISNSSLFSTFNISQCWEYTQGDAVKIGIIDCGIQLSHKALSNCSIHIIPTKEGDSSCMHGTYMASIISGSDFSNHYLGVAPKAEIVFSGISNIVNVTTNEINDCINALRDVDIINMSFSCHESAEFDPARGGRNLQMLISTLAKQNKVLVAAAGNNGPMDDKFFPAAYKDVVSVSAFMENEKGQINNSANFWQGIDIVSSYNSYFDLADDLKTYLPLKGISYNGTSSTTAFVSGVFALVASKFKQSNRPIDKQSLINACCVPITLKSSISGSTYKSNELNANAILQSLKL